jgi:hypothetical protein
VPVAWWDPSKLQLDVEEQAPLRHQKILEADAGSIAAAQSEQSYKAWSDERERLLGGASTPSLSVRTVTALVHAMERETAGSMEAGQPASLRRAGRRCASK